MAKAKNNIIETQALPKNGADIISSFSNLLLNHTNEEWRAKLCIQIREFGVRKTTVNIKDFCPEYKITYRMIEKLIELYEEIREAWNDAKEFIAANRWNGAFSRKYDKDVMFRDQHRYESDWD
jgi:hypothetical protein